MMKNIPTKIFIYFLLNTFPSLTSTALNYISVIKLEDRPFYKKNIYFNIPPFYLYITSTSISLLKTKPTKQELKCLVYSKKNEENLYMLTLLANILYKVLFIRRK